MAKYNSFNEYLEANYYNLFQESLLSHLKQVGIEDNDGCVTNYYKYDIVSLNIYRVNFTISKFNIVEFEVCLKVDILLNYSSIISRRYSGRMRGTFSKGFQFVNKVNSTSEKDEGVFTSQLVPVMHKEDYDKFATRFLKHFYPEALKKPMALDLNKLAKANDLKYYYAPLDNNILGVTYFANDTAMIYNENKNIVQIEVTPGTVLINYDKLSERGNGAARNTFIHEAVHWFFHRNYFELRQLLDNKQTKAVCYRMDTYSEEENIKWMEKQARSLTPRILMPKKNAIKKYKEIKACLKKDELVSSFNKVILIRLAIEVFADFFKVSKQSAKYRLNELGFSEVNGVFNYCDGKYLIDFTFKRNFLKSNQTFIIDHNSFSRLLEVNPVIRDAINKKILVYVNGMVVVNHKKYVDYVGSDYTLTHRALTHANECALVFTIHHTFGENFTRNDKSTFLFSTSTATKHEASIDENQYIKILSLVNDNCKHFEEHRCNLSPDFVETLKYHMKKAGYNQSELSYDSDVNEKYISQAMNRIRPLNEIEIIKISLAMRLSYPYINDLLNKADLAPRTAQGSDNCVFILSLLAGERRNLQETYLALKKIGKEQLLHLSTRYILENNL